MLYDSAFDLLVSDYCRHKTFGKFKKYIITILYGSIVQKIQNVSKLQTCVRT